MAVISLWLSMTQTRLLLVEHNTLSRQYASCGILHSLLLRASLRLTYRFANYVAAVSSGAAVDTANLAAIPVESVKVLHNPIPLRRLPNPEAKQLAENLWNCPAGQRILTVGSLKAQKNHALLLRGFKAMSDKDVHLMILGSGDQEPLRHLALELGILDRVVFAGFHVDPTPFYATADLFVLSSNYEGFGNVIVEALSFGLPIVSTDCPSGPAEILENGKWGTLVPVGDVTALAQAMAKALVAPVNHAALKRRAADFSPEIAAQKYVDLLGLDSRSR
jgi:glycosyltransferase involved in cell wall biosynthesis